jgi:hypothetical protein
VVWVRGLVGAGALLVGIGSAAIAAQRQRVSRDRMLASLLRARDEALPQRVDFASLESLPPPVARYLKGVLRDGQPCIRLARMRQDGTLKTAPDAARWIAFEATQLAAPQAPGFLWDARVGLAPLVHVRVRDAFANGRGSSAVLLASAMQLTSITDNVAIDAGALQRYLGEAVWYPTALLPSQRLSWGSIDDRSATATLRVGDLCVSLDFRFDADDRVASVYTPARWMQVDGRFEQRAREGCFAGYRACDGVVVPLRAEAGWYVEGHYVRVWRGRWTELTYEWMA